MIHKLFYAIKRMLINFVPFKSLRNKLRTENKNCHYKNKYDFVSINEKIKESPYFCNEVDTDFEISFYVVDDAYVSIFSNYSLTHKKINNKMIYFNESFNYRDNKDNIKYQLPLNKKDTINIKNCCNLYYLWNDNYWHFTFEALPKIIIMENEGFDGQYIVPDCKFIDDLLEILKIDKERIIKPTKNTLYKIEKLFIFGHITGVNIASKTKLLNCMRSTVLNNIGDLDDTLHPKKIYVKRKGTRKIKNEKNVEEILSENGFRSFIPDDMPLKNQIKLFYNADICITPHGANSTNAFYMKKNATLIEAFGHDYINFCMLHVVKLLKLNYKILQEPYYHESFEDYDINLELLEIVLSEK